MCDKSSLWLCKEVYERSKEAWSVCGVCDALAIFVRKDRVRSETLVRCTSCVRCTSLKDPSETSEALAAATA